MDELILLFLYHDLNAVTLRHFEQLRRLHPSCEIIPLGYRLACRGLLPGTIDVATSGDCGWPIRNVWREIDKIYLRWYLGNKRPRARRYVFYEYDIHPNATATAFYGPVWNEDVAAVHVRTPASYPRWRWWREAPRLRAAFPYRCGVAPLAATLWSDEALGRIAECRRFQDCYCELRMGTLARIFGFTPVPIPKAERTVSFRAGRIELSDNATWYHPIKDGRSIEKKWVQPN